MKKLISIIIPTFNEQANIGRALRSIEQQIAADCEVVVVDDNSTDQTVDLVKDFASRSKLKIILLEQTVHQERGLVRNIGAKKAKGDYLLFMDADMELTPRVCADCLAAVDQSGVVGVIIPEESKGEGFWAACRALEKRCYIGDDTIEAARFFDEEAFWQIGGWDERMISGEDWDLTRRFRKKYQIDRVDAFIYHHEGRTNPLISAKKKYYYTLQAKAYFESNPTTLKTLILFVFRPAYLRNWRLLVKDPIHALGMLITKVIELLAGVLGVIRLKLRVDR